MRILGHYEVFGYICPVFEVMDGEPSPLDDDDDEQAYGVYRQYKIFVAEDAPKHVMTHEREHFIDDISGAETFLANVVKCNNMDEVLISIRSPWVAAIRWVSCES